MVDRVLYLLLLCVGVYGQASTNGPIFFTGPEGRLAWVVDGDQPWNGSFHYLSSSRNRTALLTVADSSTGIPLGECSTTSFPPGEWVPFSWSLTSDYLSCHVSPTNASRVHFPTSPSPRSFSVRITARRGPRCVSMIEVGGTRPSGCPPTLSPLGFSSEQLDCGCPDAEETTTKEEGGATFIFDPNLVGKSTAHPIDESLAFPRFSLRPNEHREVVATLAPDAARPRQPITAHPCLTHTCENGGTCASVEGKAHCFCQDGFAGPHCERDACAGVPCQNGARCVLEGSVAHCVCPNHTKGIYCEQVVCRPECANGGVCELNQNGRPECSCPEGFISPNCNVIDTCLGDAACAVFGESAKCIVEEASILLPSNRLRNASYDCKCPSPTTPNWVDCIDLFTTTIPPLLPLRIVTATPPVPILPASSPSPSSLSPSSSSLPVPPPPSPAFPRPSHTPPTAAPTTVLLPLTEPTPPPTSPSSAPPPPGDRLIRPIHAFPTPAPMDVSEFTGTEPTTEETRPPIQWSTVTPTTIPEEQEEEATERVVHTWPPSTTEMTTEMTTESTTESTTSTTTTTATTTTTTTTTTPEPSTEPETEATTEEEPTIPIEEVEEKMEETNQNSEEDVTELIPTPATEATSRYPPSVPMGFPGRPGEDNSVGTDRQTASAIASWIVAIIAIGVLGLLLTATALFVLRYIRQSRKLHGKYNPAREEHALSATYAMPMAAVNKEERLI